jgi:hypothetical protein
LAKFSSLLFLLLASVNCYITGRFSFHLAWTVPQLQGAAATPLLQAGDQVSQHPHHRGQQSATTLRMCCPLGSSSLPNDCHAGHVIAVAGVCALKVHSSCLQDLETEILMHILEQQEQSASPAALQKAPQSSKKPAE